jgi:transcriptional regulator with XRE-family HTH domain
VLRATRLDRKLTQVELAERLERPQSFVSKYECGERRLDLVELSEVCDALEVALRDLIADYESRL